MTIYKHKFILLFSAHYDRDKGLDTGILKLWHNDRGCIEIWSGATSTANKQYKGSFHQRGGMIPPDHNLAGEKKYEVLNKPLDRRNVRGIEGNMYQILPYQLTTNRGGRRSDLAIHLDANAPGSLGCIVMNKFNFRCFESTMKELRQQNIKRLPLSVTIT